MNQTQTVFCSTLSLADAYAANAAWKLRGVVRRAIAWAGMSAARAEIGQMDTALPFENLRALLQWAHGDSDCVPSHRDLAWQFGGDGDVMGQAQKRTIARLVSNPALKASEILRAEVEKATARQRGDELAIDRALELIHGELPPPLPGQEHIQADLDEFEAQVSEASVVALVEVREAIAVKMARSIIPARVEALGSADAVASDLLTTLLGDSQEALEANRRAQRARAEAAVSEAVEAMTSAAEDALNAAREAANAATSRRRVPA